MPAFGGESGVGGFIRVSASVLSAYAAMACDETIL